jgi:uncharacterized membrane protein YebE (DUF533 family)
MKLPSNALLIALALGAATLTTIAQDTGGAPGQAARPRRQFRPLQQRAPTPQDAQRPSAPPAPQAGTDAPGQRPPAPPLVAALDANHDGIIDATEIANAAAALRTLDKNNDGQLTMDEVRRAGGFGLGGPGGPGGPGLGPRNPEIIKKYDANGDGQLDQAERDTLHQDVQSGKIQPPGRGPRGPMRSGPRGGPRGPGAAVPPAE